jgi:glycosyltransferase involved in cell wall biosynthesis
MSDLELIVVDDGSTDETAREIERFDDPRLVLIRNGVNRGVSRATNAGIARARGECLAALAADDVWLPDKLEKQLAVLDASPGVEASYTWIRYMDADGTRLRTIDRNDLGRDPVVTLLTSRRIRLACTLLVRRSAVARTALLDPRLRTNEDWEYLLRLALAGVRFAALPEALTLVRKRRGSLSWGGMSQNDLRTALTSVRQLRHAQPGRISLATVLRCWLRSELWVFASRLRVWAQLGSAGRRRDESPASVTPDSADA